MAPPAAADDDGVEDEYTQWRSEPCTEKGSSAAQNPIKYWLGMRDRYPNLSRLALDVLSIPASSCECERMFSELGDLLEPRRRKISPTQLAAIQCVRRWRRAGLLDENDNSINMGKNSLSDEDIDAIYNSVSWGSDGDSDDDAD